VIILLLLLLLLLVVVVHCCWCRVRTRFIEGLFVIDCKSVEEEFEEWFVVFDGDKGIDRVLWLRRDDTRVGRISDLGEIAGFCWRGDERL
jgi:hypothetical protein